MSTGFVSSTQQVAAPKGGHAASSTTTNPGKVQQGWQTILPAQRRRSPKAASIPCSGKCKGDGVSRILEAPKSLLWPCRSDYGGPLRGRLLLEQQPEETMGGNGDDSMPSAVLKSCCPGRSALWGALHALRRIRRIAGYVGALEGAPFRGALHAWWDTTNVVKGCCPGRSALVGALRGGRYSAEWSFVVQSLQRWEVLIFPLKMFPDLTGVQSRHLHCKSVLLLPTITHGSTSLDLRCIWDYDEKG